MREKSRPRRRGSSMAIHKEIEAWPEEEARSSMSWAVSHKVMSGGLLFRVRVSDRRGF